MKLHLPLAGAPGFDIDDAETWPEVRVCESRDHEARFATVRAHLVQGPTEYCADCAAWAKKIYEALGAHLAVEPIDLPAFITAEKRAIALDGVKQESTLR